MTPEDRQPPRLVVSVTEVRRHLGSRAPVERSLEAQGLALSDVGVPDGSTLRLVGEVESISDGIVLTGAVEVPWEGSCRRCLGPVSGVATVDVREIFETNPVEGDTWPLEHDQIDVGPLLHDTGLLALPLAPLCAEDCPGPAPDEFPALTPDQVPPGEDDDEPAEPPRDPRWAALDDLRLDDDTET